MFLDGFALAGYRSFGPELQRIAPCGKLNLIVGPNNTGKSNILRFVHQHLGQLLSSGASNQLDPIEDGPRVSQPIRFVVGIADRLVGDVVAEIQKPCKTEQSRSLLRKILESETVTARSDHVWSYRSAVNFRDQFSRWHPDIADDSIIDVFLPMMPNHEWQNIWRGLYPQHQGGDVSTAIAS